MKFQSLENHNLSIQNEISGMKFGRSFVSVVFSSVDKENVCVSGF